jgi:hypothetical protein
MVPDSSEETVPVTGELNNRLVNFLGGHSGHLADPAGPSEGSSVATWIAENRIKVLNVAGNRESRSPGIGARVERFLTEVFRRLSHER